MFCEIEVCYGKRLYLLVLTIPALVISQIKSYTFLSKMSIPGMFIAFASMIVILTICVEKVVNNDLSETEFKWFDLTEVLGYMGVAMYTFDGNVVVLNIKAEA